MDVVLLACDGAPWLPRALRALEQQSRAPDRLVLADAGSTDGSSRLLAAHASRSGLVGGPPALPVLQLTRGAGLLDAARAALAATDVAAMTAPPPGAALAERQHTAAPAAMRWVWLLHDDCAPAPDALEQLLAAVEVAPSVGVAGCKVVDWDDEGLLHQVGFSTSAMGRRLTGVEHGDRDQGQRDHRDDVLAVSTAGMLVRRDLLERLGGDPALAVLGEDLDLCRRARLAGSRVVVVPGAVVHHVDATRSGLRDTRASRAVRWTERRHEAHARLVAAPPLWLPLVALAVLAGGLLRALVRVAAKQPDRAGAELTAVLAALVRPRRVATARRAAARTAVRPRSSLRPLLVPRREVVRWHRDRWARTGIAPATGVLPVVAARVLAEGTARVLEAVTPSHGLPLLPGPARSPEAAQPAPAAGAPARSAGDAAAPAPGRPGALVLVPLLLALTALGVVALHRLLGSGQVVGGALAAVPDLSDLWTAARSDWQPGGLGAAAPSDPWLSLLAVLSAPLGGSVHAAVLALLLLALPLAALGGWAAAGAATRSRLLRAAAGVAWAGAAPLLAASATGRLGAVAAHLALPWVAVGLARATTASARRPALAAGALAGLAGAAAVSGAPGLLLPLLALVAVVALTARRWPGALLWTALPVLAAGGPLLAPALADPRVLLVGPGLPLATPAASSWRLLLADPGGALGDPLAGGLGGAAVLGVPVGALALAPGALLLVLALVGGAARGDGARGRVARTGWWAVGLGLLAAVGAARAGGWAGPGTSLVLAGLGAAALARAPRQLRAPADDAADLDDDDAWDDPDPDPGAVPAPRGARSRRPRTRWAALAAVLAVLAPLALVGAWTLQQSGGGLLERRPASAGDPAVAADAAASPDAVSTLHLSLADDGAATVTVRRGPLVVSSSSVVADLARGGSAAASARSATTAAAADAAVRSATALLAAGSDDPRTALAELGVGYVLLEPPAGSTAVSATATARLDAVTGLARAGSTDAGVLYRVLPASGSSDDAADRPSRARLLDADGGVITALASRGQDVDAVVPAADPAQALLGGRTAVVAERSDPGWTARLDGRRLPVVTVDGWALGVEVPDAGGHLVITRTGAASTVWDWMQGAVLLLTALLAVPVPVRGRRVP